MTLQRQGKEVRLLFGRALQADVFQQAVMILRDLAEGRIGRRNDRDHFGQHRIGHLRTAELARHADAPQAAVGIQVHHFGRHLAGAITLRILFQQMGGDTVRDRQRFSLVADQVGVGGMDRVNGRFRQGRHGTLSGE